MMSSDETIRRTLLALSASYALFWITTSMLAGPGSAAFVSLSGRTSLAGAFVALLYLSGAAGSAIGGRMMDAVGRRPALIAAHLFGSVGYVIGGLGVARSSLATFVAGSIVFSMAFGTVNLTRVAAAEIFTAERRGRGIGAVQTSALAGAIVGPLLLLASEPIGRAAAIAPLTLVWFFAPPLLLVAAVIVRRAAETRDIARELERVQSAGAATDSSSERANTRLTIAAAIALAGNQSAMAAVMGVAGAAMTHAGHGAGALGFVMFLHFVGMFGLSRVIGRLVDRWGRRVTILTGLGMLAAGGAVVALVPGAGGFGAGLLIVGLGWSFGFIGASALLTDVTVPARRARVLGRVDLTSQICAAAVATSAGFWFAAHGVSGLGISAIAVVTIPAVAMLFVAEQAPSQYEERTTSTVRA